MEPDLTAKDLPVKTNKLALVMILFFLGLVNILAAGTREDRADWTRRQVDWRVSRGLRIKAIRYPQSDAPSFLQERIENRRRPVIRKRFVRPAPAVKAAPGPRVETNADITDTSETLGGSAVFMNVIDGPPIDGFIPWIVVTATNARQGELEMDAQPWPFVKGQFFTAQPESDYVIGLFDTGASTFVVGNEDGYRLGILDTTKRMLTGFETEISGATPGSVMASVTHPLGLFIDGLGALELASIDPNNPDNKDYLLLDRSGMVGETNISILVGQEVSGDQPDLPTAIGSPMAAYFTASFDNENPVTIVRDGEEFTAPDIRFYSGSEPNLPSYPNRIELQLRPENSTNVQYFPCLVGFMECPNDEFVPMSPSVINNFNGPTQSLYFVKTVNLHHSGEDISTDGFMLDTGAQITVISTATAGLLRLGPDDVDFETEITGVTGETVIVPGYYLDSLELPAFGEWLTFTHVPVIRLDVPSPELGQTLEGIIGMNLFVDTNFVIHHGGLAGQLSPHLDFELLPETIPGDIAPGRGDGIVDILDLAQLSQCWLATTVDKNYTGKCDLYPEPVPDGLVNLRDFQVLAGHWLQQRLP